MQVIRVIQNKLFKEINKSFISILIGPRQVGKTYLLKVIQQECEKRKLSTAYYNLEDPRDLQLFQGSDIEILNNIFNNVDVVFIDEFHYLKNATKIFKIHYDSNNSKKIYASGSSSLEIHKHLKESLAGRFRLTKIFPLYYKEIKQLNFFDENYFLNFGGLPGLIHEDTTEEKIGLLKNIIETYLFKDIKSLIKEENIRAYNNLLYIIAQNQGSTVSMASYAKEVGMSEPTIKYYLELMAQTFVCFPLESYSKNLANELKKTKKYYLYDLGVRNMILNDFSSIHLRQDKGAIIETYIFLSIIKQLKANMDVKFWRTRQGNEVDFIVLKNRVPYPIEVKAGETKYAIPSGLKVFLTKYPDSPYGIVFSADKDRDIEFHDRVVRFINWRNAEDIDFMQNVD